MGKRFTLSESEKNNIRRMYGLLTEQVVKRVTIQGIQPAANTDWDLVHGILGSKRLDDDLEQRVGDELKNGNFRVTKVYVSSKKVGNQIVTDAAVDLSEAQNNQLPHKVFTTRGSIGADYEQRHDTQVSGLEDRLKNNYKGDVTVFGPYTIQVGGTNVKYKQSFYAIEGQPSGTNMNQTQQPIPITGSNFEDLRTKLKSQSYPQNIDVNSLKFDPSTFTVTYSPGQTQIKGMSLLIDDKGALDSRIGAIYDKNKQDGLTMVYPKNLRGKSGNLDYQLVYFQ